MQGYAGRILRVNLGSLTVDVDSVPEETLALYLGGRGLSANILFNEIRAGVDPLGPDNKLVFMTGPVTGTHIPGSGRHLVASKSPLTGVWGEATSGGRWGVQLKKAGFDGIIVEGRARHPVLLYVCDGKAEIRSAEGLWGLTTSETDRQIRVTLGSGVSSCCIGPSGEKLARIACIVNDLHDVAGRTGLGAVMGSKHLKAIAVRGRGDIRVSAPRQVETLRGLLWERFKDWDWIPNLRANGTPGSVASLNAGGMLPTRNFQSTYFEGADRISLDRLHATGVTSSRTCWGCPVACKKFVTIDGQLYKAPEYETAAAFGSLCLNADYPSIVEANRICNEYGLDTISAGVTLAFAMECYDQGILTLEDTGGIDLTWGNHRGVLSLLRLMADRSGLGEILSNGVRDSARIIGQGSWVYAMHVKGLEIPMHTPRSKGIGLGLSYATCAKGACHNQCAHDPYFETEHHMSSLGVRSKIQRQQVEGKAHAVMITEDRRGLTNSMVVCHFTSFEVVGMEDLAAVISATTGWRAMPEDLLRIGERANALTRAFSVREGVTSNDDCLPDRFHEPVADGPAKGLRISREHFGSLVADYYRARGWDSNGCPSEERLRELGLDFAAECLWGPTGSCRCGEAET